MDQRSCVSRPQKKQQMLKVVEVYFFSFVKICNIPFFSRILQEINWNSLNSFGEADIRVVLSCNS